MYASTPFGMPTPPMQPDRTVRIGSRERLAVLWSLRVHRGGLTRLQLLRQTGLHPESLDVAIHGLRVDQAVECLRHGDVAVFRIPTRRLERLQ